MSRFDSRNGRVNLTFAGFYFVMTVALLAVSVMTFAAGLVWVGVALVLIAALAAWFGRVFLRDGRAERSALIAERERAERASARIAQTMGRRD